MRILTINVGSSSLKLSVVDEHGERLGTSSLTGSDGPFDTGELEASLENSGTLDAVVHRIVHGGTEFVDPVVVDEEVRRRLWSLTDLAPLHLPNSLRALDASCRVLPDVPQVGCFDTAFHASMPPEAATYPLPRSWQEQWGVRHFGFHGLSYSYAAGRAREMLNDRSDLRLVIGHLGAGASLAAVRGMRSLDTTMGFTPLDGLMMATRAGSVDPGLVLWLQERHGLSPSELGDVLEHHSGLLGVAGSADLRTVLEAERRGDPDATLALGIYVHRLRAGVAAMASAAGGLDALVFTGGVGENSAVIRQRVGDGLGFLGVSIDREANMAVSPDATIGSSGTSAQVLVIAAREDVVMGRAAIALLR